MTMADNPIHKGGCLCGAVRYRAVAGDSPTVTHCHCRMCRKATGGSFITWFEFPAKDFAWTSGEPRYFRSSDLSERGFCGHCGCQLTFRDVGDPGGFDSDIWVALGGLDRAGDIVPTHHIFTNFQLPGLDLDDGLPRWPEQLPWLVLDGELPHPTVPEDTDDEQPTATPAADDSHEGGCLCGAVRYRATVGDAPTVSHCHCAMCRKVTGATLVTWVLVPAEGFAFTKGEPVRYRSSEVVERRFCGACGCHFIFRFTGDEVDPLSRLWIALGSTDRPETLEPTHQAFTDDRLPWLNLGGDLQTWPGMLTGPRAGDSL
jgi:hypothetical protein